MVYKVLAVCAAAILFTACGSGNTPEGAPSIVSDSIGEGSSVSIAPTLVFTFNKDIDDLRNSESNVYLYDSNNTRLDGTASISGDALRFTPTTQLNYDANYTVSVRDVIDLTATPMKHAYTKLFTTTSFVKSLSPADADANVSVFSDITVVFGAPIDPASLTVTVSNLTFTTAAASDNQTFILSPNGGTGFDSNYSGLLPSTSYTISINQATDIYDTNLSAAVSAVFSTVPPDVTAPVIVASTPSDGATTVAADTNLSLRFDEDIITPAASQITMTDDTQASIAVTIAYDAVSREVTLTPSAQLDYARGYTISLFNISDIFGNTMSDTVTFTTSTILNAVSPADGESDVAVDGFVSALFEGEINSTLALFTLKNSGGVSVAGTTAFGTTTARFVPTSDLAFSTTYTATISGIRDANGNLLADQSWSFTTQEDYIAPQRVSLTPADQSTGVTVGSNISAMYDESVGGSAAFIVQDSGGNSVKGEVSYSGSSVVFNPTASLSAAETYTVYLSGVTDLGGNKAATEIWTFETE